jgi:hypothetical protein
VRLPHRQYRYIVAIWVFDPISWLTDDYSTATILCVGAYDRRSVRMNDMAVRNCVKPPKFRNDVRPDASPKSRAAKSYTSLCGIFAWVEIERAVQVTG